MRGASTKEENHGKYYKSDDHEHLERCEPKFRFPVDLDREAVQGDDDNHEDGNPDSDWHTVGPVVNDKTSCGDLVRYDDGKRIRIEPAHCEPILLVRW